VEEQSLRGTGNAPDAYTDPAGGKGGLDLHVRLRNT